MSQFEKMTIMRELIHYLNAFTHSLESLPAYYPSHLSMDQLYQTMRVKEHHPFASSQQQVSRVHEFYPMEEPSLEDDFSQEWITQAHLWEEGIGDDQTKFTLPASDTQEWSLLRQYVKRAILLGHPGSGKSWLLRYEGLRVAREHLGILQDNQGSLDDFVLPLYVPLAALAEELEQWDGDIYETLARMVQRSANLSETFLQWVKRWLASHSSLLLLDGLEEVADHRYLTVTKALQQVATHPRCRIFLTSRITGYRGIPFHLGYTAQEKELELLPFNREQVNSFIAAWYSSAPQQVSMLQETVQETETLRPFLRLPFLLSFFCLVCGVQQTPPLKRVSLYEATLRALLRETSSFDRHQRSEEQIEALMNVLEFIAWQSTSPTGFWPAHLLEQEVQRIITEHEGQEFMEDVSTLLENLVVTSGILEKREVSDTSGNGRKWAYRFTYYPFCHYLVARSLARKPARDWLTLTQKKQFEDPDWAHVFPLLAGCLQNAEPLLDVLTEETKPTVAMALLAGRCFVETNRASIHLRLKKRMITHLRTVSFMASDQERRQIGMLLVQLYDSASLERLRAILWDEKSILATRCAAIWALGVLGKKEVVDDLEIALWEHDRDAYGMVTARHYLRCVAAWGVGRLADSQAVGELMRIASEQEEHEHVLCAAAWASGQLKERQAAQVLTALLPHQNVSVRVAAIWALGELRSSSVFDDLFALLFDEDVYVRVAAQQALIRIGRTVVPELVVRFEKPELEAEKRISIAWVLGEIGDARAVPSLLAVLNEPNGEVHRSAIVALSRIGDQFAADKLLTLLWDKSEDENIRMEAARALASLGDSRLVPALFDSLRDQNKYGLFSTEISLLVAKVADQRTLSFLVEVLQKQDTVLCRLAGEILGRIGDQSISQDLMDIIQDRSKIATVRASSIMALREIERGKHLVDVWLNLLHDTSAEVRSEAIEAMGNIGDRAMLHHIKLFLYDKSVTVRRKSVEALGRIGGEEAFTIVCEVAQNMREESVIRVAAIEVLGMIGGEDLWKVMRQILLSGCSDHSVVVHAAINTLKKMKDPQSVEVLLEALQVQDEVKQWKAAEALGEIADVRAVEGLLVALRDEKKSVRMTSARALGKIRHSQAVFGLLLAVQDTCRDVSQAALVALGQIDDDQARQGLHTALQDGDEATQETAALVLVRAGDVKGVGKLLSILRDPDESRNLHTRVKALRAVCRLGDPVAMKDLLALLWNDDEIIRSETASYFLDLDISLLAHFLCQEYR